MASTESVETFLYYEMNLGKKLLTYAKSIAFSSIGRSLNEDEEKALIAGINNNYVDYAVRIPLFEKIFQETATPEEKKLIESKLEELSNKLDILDPNKLSGDQAKLGEQLKKDYLAFKHEFDKEWFQKQLQKDPSFEPLKIEDLPPRNPQQ